ncbi:MAG: sigma-70 family RNA polymerase sigma factor [Gammaproteobacteria bacterium]|nr:sigma-70 family RNA polymerase sigma factor [Gammaproteobacteria bacterium]
MNEAAADLTSMLQRWSGGDQQARDELVARVYRELKSIARVQLLSERGNHTLQPTALVHEAWLKLINIDQVEWQDRVHFIAVSARIMRQILVDSGRRKRAAKRQPEMPLTIPAGVRGSADEAIDVLALDAAMSQLEALNPMHANVVELRYFGGLTIPETAAALNVSTPTVNRAWRAARSWLYLHMQPQSEQASN